MFFIFGAKMGITVLNMKKSTLNGRNQGMNREKSGAVG